MSSFVRFLLLAAALCPAAGRPACCVADVFVARGCCAEAVAVAQAKRDCGCCGSRPVDRGEQRWMRGASSCTDTCACCARSPVATHPAGGDDARPCPAVLSCTTILQPPAPRFLRAETPSTGSPAPPAPRLLPLLL